MHRLLRRKRYKQTQDTNKSTIEYIKNVDNSNEKHWLTPSLFHPRRETVTATTYHSLNSNT